MITCECLGNLGRLGNQMFQIASTIGIAKKNNLEYFFPHWEYQEFFAKELPFKNIKAEFRLSEGLCDYRETNLPNDKIYHLYGYLQSPKYFDECREEVLSYFEPEQSLVHHIKNKYEGYENKTSIHVRRSDYIILKDYHTLLDMNYYKEAIELMGEHEDFLVFSDDIEWCKENLKDYNCEYVEERPHDKETTQVFSQLPKEEDSKKFKKEDVIELFLMSMCKNNIIANSSYSWWAAYINKNTNKKIIAPKDWFTPERAARIYRDKENYIKHRIPEEWILV